MASMFFDQLKAGARFGQRPAICVDRAITSWQELSDRIDTCVAALSGCARMRVGIRFTASPNVVAALAALDHLEADVFLLDAQRSTHDLLEWAQQLRLAVMLDVHEADGQRFEPRYLNADRAASGPSSVTLLTSGTTGLPKATRHTWRSLVRPVRPVPEPQVWLLTYAPHLYAGLQVILQSLWNYGTLVVPGTLVDPTRIATCMLRYQVGYASATPSYWRRLVLFADRSLLAQVPLKQITLGGEAVDQPLLDQLKSLFPGSRVTHIYATTELGRCFAVTDGKSGFPASYLDQCTDSGVELQIRDGQLWVRSENAAEGYDPFSVAGTPTTLWASDADGWIATGDLVERQGDRILFRGRLSDVINVGGNKVQPLEVETCIRQLPEVADVRVYAERSSIGGQLVACEVVPSPSVSPTVVRQRVVEHCATSLPRFQQPRIVRVIDRIELSAAGKTIRGEGPINE